MYFPSEIIVDTGPFFDFLLSEFEVCYYRKVRYEKLQYIKNETSWNKLRNYFYNIDIYTTPSVIVEINYQARKHYKKQLLSIFWEFTYKLLENKKLKEEFISILKMEPKTVGLFGPTDASLIKLACLSKKEILTGDYSLWSYCRNRKIRTLFIFELTESI